MGRGGGRQTLGCSCACALICSEVTVRSFREFSCGYVGGCWALGFKVQRAPFGGLALALDSRRSPTSPRDVLRNVRR